MNARPRSFPWLLAALLVACVDCGPAVAGEKLVLTAEQSTGGKSVTLSGGAVAATLDATCSAQGERGVGIEWKAPLPAGWWHGTLHLAPREGEDKGWVNTHVGIALMSPQKTMVNMMTNFRLQDRNMNEQTFSFW